MAKTYTIDMMAAEMEVIATTLRTASESDRDAILAKLDQVALKSAKLTGLEAAKLKAQLEIIATQLEKANEAMFAQLGEQLQNCLVEVMCKLKGLEMGQEMILKNQDSWGTKIIEGLRALGNRIGSYVSTPVIVIEAIIAIIAGIIAGWRVKVGSAVQLQQLFDPDTKTAIMAVPKYTNWEQWVLAVCGGVMIAALVFGVAYGVTKLVTRHRK